MKSLLGGVPGGAEEGLDDGEDDGVSVVPPDGLEVALDDGLACVEGLVWGELLPVVFWPMVGVQALAKRKSPATRAPALHNRPVM